MILDVLLLPDSQRAYIAPIGVMNEITGFRAPHNCGASRQGWKTSRTLTGGGGGGGGGIAEGGLLQVNLDMTDHCMTDFCI